MKRKFVFVFFFFLERKSGEVTNGGPRSRAAEKGDGGRWGGGTSALLFLAVNTTNESRPYKVDIHSCPVRGLPVQVCTVMNLAVIQTPTVNPLNRSKLEQSRETIYIYIYICFFYK